MASPFLKAFLATLLLLALILPDNVCDATNHKQWSRKKHHRHGKGHRQRSWKGRNGGKHVNGKGRHRGSGVPRSRSPLPSDGWKKAHATFYEGNSLTFGGACGFEDVNKEGYGIGTAALSTVLFNNGQSCGACFEIKCCDAPQWCKPGNPSLFVTGTNLCPPNFNQASDNGGWCNPPREHFDIAYPAFSQIAEYKAGIVPIQYRRVPCQKQGGIRFLISGNSYYHMISVWNVGGAGDIVNFEVKGDGKLPWTKLHRNWGEKWQTDAKLCGEALTFKVGLSDGTSLTLNNVFPKNWQFAQTFEGKNFN